MYLETGGPTVFLILLCKCLDVMHYVLLVVFKFMGDISLLIHTLEVMVMESPFLISWLFIKQFQPEWFSTNVPSYAQGN